MLTLISTILGALSGILPNVVKIFENKTNYAHELEMAKLRFQAAKEGIEFQTLVDEGKSLRDHDASIGSDSFFEPLRASIRPVITYLFFFMFCFIKILAATFMFNEDYNAIQISSALLDEYTMAIFGAIMGFWFGSRAITKIYGDFLENKPKLLNTTPAKLLGGGISKTLPIEQTRKKETQNERTISKRNPAGSVWDSSNHP